MAQKVEGKLYESITGQLFEIGRQLRQKKGYSFDPEVLQNHLQDAIEGKFPYREILVIKKHTVDLSKQPRLPFDGAEVAKHDGNGVVEIELRSDDNLYLDGKKVELFLSERQKGDNRIVGHELRQELEDGNQVLFNSNVLDYIYDHSELFPEHWKKKDENGDVRCIFFWGSIFQGPSNGALHVRSLCWDDGGLRRFYDWLDEDWDRLSPSASVAS